MIERRWKTRSVAGTLNIAERIAETLMPTPRLVILRGDLGAGKTTLTKGLASTLTGTDPEDVTSPTFTLVHEYDGPRVKVYHLDLYRLETERQLATLGLEEMIADPHAIVLIEWGEKFLSVRDRADAQIDMAHLEGDERSLLVRWHE